MQALNRPVLSLILIDEVFDRTEEELRHAKDLQEAFAVYDELRTHGVDPRFVLQAETGSGVQGLVAAGLGAAIVPRVAADDNRVETVVLELADDVVAQRSIVAVWSRTQPLSRDAAAFVDAARSACAGERLHAASLA